MSKVEKVCYIILLYCMVIGLAGIYDSLQYNSYTGTVVEAQEPTKKGAVYYQDMTVKVQGKIKKLEDVRISDDGYYNGDDIRYKVSKMDGEIYLSKDSGLGFVKYGLVATTVVLIIGFCCIKFKKLINK